MSVPGFAWIVKDVFIVGNLAWGAAQKGVVRESKAASQLSKQRIVFSSRDARLVLISRHLYLSLPYNPVGLKTIHIVIIPLWMSVENYSMRQLRIETALLGRHPPCLPRNSLVSQKECLRRHDPMQRRIAHWKHCRA
jgi:hypothetical protein